jgi:hypothetical protein
MPLCPVMSALPLKPMSTPHSLVTLAVITVSIAAALPIALALEPGQVSPPLCPRRPPGLGLDTEFTSPSSVLPDVDGRGVPRARVPKSPGFERRADPGPVRQQGALTGPVAGRANFVAAQPPGRGCRPTDRLPIPPSDFSMSRPPSPPRDTGNIGICYLFIHFTF